MDNALDIVLVLIDTKAVGLATFIKTFGPMHPVDCGLAVGQIMRQSVETGIHAACATLQAVK